VTESQKGNWGKELKSKSGAFLVIVFEDHTQNREQGRLCQPPVIGWKSSRGG